MKQALKKIVVFSVSIAGLAWGGIVYLLSRRTPAFSYQSMIRLFCLTKGRSNDALSSFVSMLNPPYWLPSADGVLGNLGGSDLDRVVADIRRNGYHVFDRLLSAETCDALLKVALSSKCKVRAMDEGGGRISDVPRYERSRPQGVRYDLLPDDVVNQPVVQRLMADLSLIAVAQQYLGARPVADVTALWWSTAYSTRADAEAAQMFHFDMDRIKWLKFFICITDVTQRSGPHTYVAGSHRTGAIPSDLLAAGYARLTDAEVSKHFNRGSFMEFCAPRGTILAEDTRGLHKGKNVEFGDRLMFQVQFSNSLFGATIHGGKFRELLDPGIRDLAARYPRLYSNFTPT
jgi:hypothetical protein